MNQSLEKQLNTKQREELLGRIMKNIEIERSKQQRRNTVFFCCTLVASLAVILPAFNFLRQNILSSGFMDFLSLAFSDPALVARYWQSFVLSLLEALPVVSLAVFLSVVLALLESIRRLAIVNINQSNKVSLKLN